MSYKGLGAIIGFVIGLVLCVIIFIVCNKNGKVKSEYDERQEAIRGRGYKYGFYTAMFYFAFLAIWPLTEIELPFSDTVQAFIGILLSVLVMAVYSVWNDAYWAINNNKGRYVLFFVLATIVNLIVGVKAIVEGEMFVDGQIQAPGVNLLCGVMFVVIAGVLGLKLLAEKQED